MKILAVDTSGFEGSIALSEDRNVLAERSLATEGRRHAQTLVAEADQLLRRQNLQPADIDVVAVSIGPGSFTGLRVGVVFAKTFAWANHARLVAVDTLQAIAQQVESRATNVTVISDAQRKEVFVNDYAWDAATETCVPTDSLKIEPVSELSARFDALPAEKRSQITGPGLIKFAEALPEGCRVAAEQLWQPRASTVAVIGHLLATRDQFADVYTLEPLYVRRSYAEEAAAKQ